MYQKHQTRTIKTTISQQYTSFVFPFAFPFAETRSVVWRRNAFSLIVLLDRYTNIDVILQFID